MTLLSNQVSPLLHFLHRSELQHIYTLVDACVPYLVTASLAVKFLSSCIVASGQREQRSGILRDLVLLDKNILHSMHVQSLKISGEEYWKTLVSQWKGQSECNLPCMVVVCIHQHTFVFVFYLL